MQDEQQHPAAASPALEPAQVVELLRGPQADAWLAGLGAGERADVASTLKRALVDSELAGTYTTPDLLAAFVRLGGSEAELDTAVLSAAAVRRDEVSPAGLAVVWSRLVRVQENLTEGEVRSWLSIDMIRGLAARSKTWTRFSAIELSDWARKSTTSTTETGLAQYLVAKHPVESAAVLAQAMREDPHGAEHLTSRLDEKTLAALAAAVVDDASIPAGLRVTLATGAGETVKARARAMVARELSLSNEMLARLAPETDDTDDQDRYGSTPAARRLAWATAGFAFLIGTILQLGFQAALIFALAMFAIAWLVGREEPEDDAEDDAA